MPATEEAERIGVLDFPSMAALLVRENKLHKGHFELSMQFNIAAGLFAAPGMAPGPGVMTTVANIGLKQVPVPSLMSVDAAVVNPPKSPAKAARASIKKTPV